MATPAQAGTSPDMADIVITEFLDADAVASIGSRYRVFWDDGLADAPDRLHALVGEARGLIVRNRTMVDEPLLAAAPRLEVIGRLGVGLDNIDTDACARRGIKVIPAIGANADSVAEYVMAALLTMMRPVWSVTGEMLAGDFPRAALSGGREIGGKTLGLLGFGGIGRMVAKRALALGMEVAVYDPVLQAPLELEVASYPLAECLAMADAISLHMPLTDETRGLIDADALSRMKSGAVLINTARGGIVDHVALAEALRSGHLGGAAIDVFDSEPTTKDSLAMFAGLNNVWLTPHIAGVSVEATTRVSWMTVRAVVETLDGNG